MQYSDTTVECSTVLIAGAHPPLLADPSVCPSVGGVSGSRVGGGAWPGRGREGWPLAAEAKPRRRNGDTPEYEARPLAVMVD